MSQSAKINTTLLLLSTFSVAFLPACMSLAKKSDIDRNGIRKAFVDNQKEIAECYDTLANAKKLKGKMVFDFTIDDQGKVISSTISEEKSTLKDKALGECIATKMKSWTFPKSASTETTQVFYPLLFTPKD